MRPGVTHWFLVPRVRWLQSNEMRFLPTLRQSLPFLLAVWQRGAASCVLVPPPAVTNTCSPYHALALIRPLQVDGGTFPSHYQWWNLMGCPNSQMEGGTGIAWTTWSKLLAVVLIAVLGLPAVALAVATLLLCLPCFYSRIKQSGCWSTFVGIISFWGYVKGVASEPSPCVVSHTPHACWCSYFIIFSPCIAIFSPCMIAMICCGDRKPKNKQATPGAGQPPTGAAKPAQAATTAEGVGGKGHAARGATATTDAEVKGDASSMV